jgi:hypothetical protein
MNSSEVAGAGAALGVFGARAGFSAAGVSTFGLRARGALFATGVALATAGVSLISAFFLAILFLRAALFWATLTRAKAKIFTINRFG